MVEHKNAKGVRTCTNQQAEKKRARKNLAEAKKTDENRFNMLKYRHQKYKQYQNSDKWDEMKMKTKKDKTQANHIIECDAYAMAIKIIVTFRLFVYQI